MNSFNLTSIFGSGVALPISIPGVVFTLILAALLSYICAKVFTSTLPKQMKIKQYHTFITTMVLIAAIVSMIMILVGTNLARAFALVGMLHLVRFRNASKGPGDLIFIFAGIAIGMACGIQYYELAITFTLVISSLVFILNFFNTDKAEEETKIDDESSTEEDMSTPL